MRRAGANSCSAARSSHAVDGILRDNPAANRYEYRLAGVLAYVTYQRAPGVTTLSFARVPEELAGAGIGSAMARAVLEEERRLGNRVRPTCGFIAGYIARHPEFANLSAD